MDNRGGELFKMIAKVDMIHVPFKGTGPAITDLVASHMATIISNIPSVLPMVKAKKLRALAVTSPKRSSIVPDLPTVAESGLPGYEVEIWYGVLAPAGISKPIVARLKALAASPALPPAAELVARMAEGEYKELAGAAVILSTSGTTSAPKGVMLGHEGTIRLACAVAERQDLGPDQRFYTVGPFFHCTGYMHGLLTNLMAGSTLFTSRRYTPEEAWDILSRERINAYHGSIVPLQEIALLPQFRKENIAPLTRAWYSAPATEMARLEDLLGTRMCEVYGLTETAGNVSICHVSDPVDMRHDSDGRPHDGVEVSIIDPDTGRRVPDGTPGELCVKGWNLMLGYFRDPAATSQAIDPDGWLHTGDQGVRLPDGYIKFLSRLKDVIRVGGENLSPLEVEEVLMAHPYVREAVVVAAPDSRLDEVPVAFLVLRPRCSPSAEELAAHCRRQLAAFKVPTRFIFVEDLPRSNAVMRVQKAKLREMLASETSQPSARPD